MVTQLSPRKAEREQTEKEMPEKKANCEKPPEEGDETDREK